MPIYIADPNLLTFPTPRRFLLGYSALCDEPLLLSPTVAFEAGRRTAANAVAAYDRRTDFPRKETARALHEALAGWLDVEMDRDDSPMLRLSDRNPFLEMEGARVAHALPLEAFAGGRETGQHNNDARIVGEALVADVDMVLTNNMSSIRHGLLNRHIERTRGRNEPFVRTANAGMEALLGADAPRQAHLIVSCMSLPERQQPEEAEALAFERFCSRLEQALGFCARAAHDHEQPGHGRDNRDRARKLIERPAWRMARQCEARRIEVERSILRQAERKGMGR